MSIVANSSSARFGQLGFAVDYAFRAGSNEGVSLLACEGLSVDRPRASSADEGERLRAAGRLKGQLRALCAGNKRWRIAIENTERDGDLPHVVYRTALSPAPGSRPMDRDEWRGCIGLYLDTAFRRGGGAPATVGAWFATSHAKPGSHRRPDHAHLVVHLLDRRGAVLPCRGNWVANEAFGARHASRRGEGIVLGRHAKAVVALLERIGDHGALAAYGLALRRRLQTEVANGRVELALDLQGQRPRELARLYTKRVWPLARADQEGETAAAIVRVLDGRAGADAVSALHAAGYDLAWGDRGGGAGRRPMLVAAPHPDLLGQRGRPISLVRAYTDAVLGARAGGSTATAEAEAWVAAVVAGLPNLPTVGALRDRDDPSRPALAGSRAGAERAEGRAREAAASVRRARALVRGEQDGLRRARLREDLEAKLADAARLRVAAKVERGDAVRASRPRISTPNVAGVALHEGRVRVEGDAIEISRPYAGGAGKRLAQQDGQIFDRVVEAAFAMNGGAGPYEITGPARLPYGGAHLLLGMVERGIGPAAFPRLSSDERLASEARARWNASGSAAAERRRRPDLADAASPAPLRPSTPVPEASPAAPRGPAASATGFGAGTRDGADAGAAEARRGVPAPSSMGTIRLPGSGAAAPPVHPAVPRPEGVAALPEPPRPGSAAATPYKPVAAHPSPTRSPEPPRWSMPSSVRDLFRRRPGAQPAGHAVALTAPADKDPGPLGASTGSDTGSLGAPSPQIDRAAAARVPALSYEAAKRERDAAGRRTRIERRSAMRDAFRSFGTSAAAVVEAAAALGAAVPGIRKDVEQRHHARGGGSVAAAALEAEPAYMALLRSDSQASDAAHAFASAVDTLARSADRLADASAEGGGLGPARVSAMRSMRAAVQGAAAWIPRAPAELEPVAFRLWHALDPLRVTKGAGWRIPPMGHVNETDEDRWSAQRWLAAEAEGNSRIGRSAAIQVQR